jgi:glycosyltransferase involved in cell wall biosynthesis
LLGSEPGLTWNWARHLAAYHEIDVITHPQHRGVIEAELTMRPCSNLHFHFVQPSCSVNPWNPARGDKGIRLHYAFWQERVLEVAARLHHQRLFDLAHHASWASINHVPPIWRLGLPFVWGPIGGGQTWPSAFKQYADHKSNAVEGLRKLALKVSRLNPWVTLAVRHADLICASNPETADILRRLRARRVELFFDNGVLASQLRPKSNDRKAREGLLLLWGGRLIPLKALPLALEAIAATANPAIRLLVAGDGPMRTAWQEMTVRLGLASQVQFLGNVPRARMFELFAQADALLFTSLRESTGSVVLEAMSQGLPIITVDHQGIGGFVRPEAGVKIPVTNPQETVRGFADALTRLAANPAELSAMATASLRGAAAETWELRAQRMTDRYEEVLSAHRRL